MRFHGQASVVIRLRNFLTAALAFELPIPVSLSADDVELFQSKAWRIDANVAAVAGFVLAMKLQLIPDCRRTSNVRLDGGNTWWRRGSRLPQQLVQNPDATQHRRRARSIRGDFQNTRMREHSATDTVRRKLNDSKIFVTLHAGDSVMSCQTLVQHCEVGIHKVEHAQIFFQQMPEKAASFRQH